MARTNAQLNAEKWVVNEGLSDFPGGPFTGRKARLQWGGDFAFDVVNADESIVGNISTSSVFTARNKRGVAKIQKIKCDTLYLMYAKKAKKRLLIFTEANMKSYFEKEVSNGRFPKGVKLLYIALPRDLQMAVETARQEASDETTPEGMKKQREKVQ